MTMRWMTWGGAKEVIILPIAAPYINLEYGPSSSTLIRCLVLYSEALEDWTGLVMTFKLEHLEQM